LAPDVQGLAQVVPPDVQDLAQMGPNSRNMMTWYRLVRVHGHFQLPKLE
jgi:hypothetical protein